MINCPIHSLVVLDDIVNKNIKVGQKIKHYTFDNRTEGIYPLLNKIIPEIEQHTRVYGRNDRTLSLCKHLLIELLTNGVKHSDADTSLIVILLDEKEIEVSKYDDGKPFVLKDYPGWPLNSIHKGKKLLIHKDDFFALYARIESENMISFEFEEYPIGTLNVTTNLAEHYGLLIITKASNSFSYRYSNGGMINHFKAVIALGE